MRILFFHKNFPGRFGFMAAHLAANPEHEVLFASCHQRSGAAVPRVRRVIVKPDAARRPPREENYAQIWCGAMLSGKSRYTFLERLNAEFRPHWVLSSAFGGISFFVPRAFPQAFHVFYAGLEHAPRTAEGLSEAKKAELAMQGMQALQSRLCFAFCEEQRNLFPEVLRPAVRLMTPWVDTDWMRPGISAGFQHGTFTPAPGSELVSFDMQSAAAARASSLLKLAAALLGARPSCRMVLCFGGNPVRGMFEAWHGGLPESLRRRVCLADFLRPGEYRDLFRASAIHVCAEARPSPPPGWLEAMSCGAALMMPAPAADALLKPGENMLPFPSGGWEEQLEAVVEALDQPDRLAAIGAGARRDIVKALSPQVLVPPHVALLLAEYEAFRKENA